MLIHAYTTYLSFHFLSIKIVFTGDEKYKTPFNNRQKQFVEIYVQMENTEC